MKEKAKLSRMDAVHRLEDLARQLAEGTIQLGDKSFPISDDVRVTIRAHRDELEIALKWRPNERQAEPAPASQEEQASAPR